MLKVLLRSSALVLLMGSVFSPLEAGKNTKDGEDDKLVTKSISSKKKETEGDEEKEFSLLNALNLGLDMDELTALPKGWNLVDSSKSRDINNPISLKKKPEGVELLGDNYTFYTNVPALKDFDKTTFVFSANVRSTSPGVYLQYYDGKNVVNSAPYASKKGAWETLNIEFTVDANAKFHRLYSAILGAVKGNDKPSVDINSIKLQRKQIVEQNVVESEEKAPELPPRDKLVEPSKKRALPTPPGKKEAPSTQVVPSAKVAPSPEPAKAAVTSEALLHRTIMAGLEGQGGAYEAAVKKARALVEDIRGTKTESFIVPYLNLAEYLFAFGQINSEKRTQSFQEAYELYDKHLNYSKIYELLQLGEKQKILDGQSQLMPMARELKTNFKISGVVCLFLGHYEEAIDRLETSLGIIDDTRDYDPEETLRGTALAAWAEAKEDFKQEEYPIKAAAYFEAYFKLNPKRVDLDDYIKAAKSAWEASKFSLGEAWETLKNMNSRLDVRYAIGEQDTYKFMEQSGPFVSMEKKVDNEINHLDNFFDQIGKEQPEDEFEAAFHDEANKANDIYQAHMRRLAIDWLAKVVDTKELTKQQISPELKDIYDNLRAKIARSTIDDSSVDLNPNGYVSYVKPDPQRYMNEANLAIKNESYDYASFLADQMVKKFPDQQDNMNFMADLIKSRILAAKMEK